MKNEKKKVKKLTDEEIGQVAGGVPGKPHYIVTVGEVTTGMTVTGISGTEKTLKLVKDANDGDPEKINQ